MLAMQETRPLKTGDYDRLEGRKGTGQMVRPGKNSQTEAGDRMLKNSETRLKSRRRWKKPAHLTKEGDYLDGRKETRLQTGEQPVR
jgi:hypothetical protein